MASHHQRPAELPGRAAAVGEWDTVELSAGLTRPV